MREKRRPYIPEQRSGRPKLFESHIHDLWREAAHRYYVRNRDKILDKAKAKKEAENG